VDVGDVVELVLVDEGVMYDVSHPFHLHGHKFFVVAMQRHAKNASHIGPDQGKGNLKQSLFVSALAVFEVPC
jgi:FtsP/CotA-like multicopper oxidase with cupredoxin domain